MAIASDQGTPKPFSLRATGGVARRQFYSRASFWLLLLATMSGMGVVAFLMIDVFNQGFTRVFADWPAFFTNYASRREVQAGIRAAILGSAWVIGLTVLFTVPVGVGTAIFMEEFAPRNKLLSLIRLNISNLAGVPSILYGLLGLAVFSRLMGLGGVILTGALTLSLMILPIVVISASEAVRQVPPSIRDGALALGATRWQAVWYHILPGSIPGIMTGVILAISRAAGETAALIMIGAFAFIAFDPTGWNDRFTILPIQVYEWTLRPGESFKVEASAGIIVLLVSVITLNLTAAIIRQRFRRD